MNNFERIKNMSLDEMAEFFGNYFRCDDCPMLDSEDCGARCNIAFKQWLEREAQNV